MGDVIEAAWRNGARLDGWTEHFNNDAWTAAFAQANLDPANYRREISTNAPTPWSHIHCPRRCDFLLAEYERMQQALTD